MDGLDFQILKKSLPELIAECHGRLIGNESILLVSHRFGFKDTELSAHEFMLSFLSEMKNFGLKISSVSDVSVLVENLGLEDNYPSPTNFVKLITENAGPEAARGMLDVVTREIMVYIIEKPSTWKKFDRTEPFSERDDIKTYADPSEPLDKTSNWFVSKLQERENFLQKKEMVTLKITNKEVLDVARQVAGGDPMAYLVSLGKYFRYSSAFAYFLAMQEFAMDRERAAPTGGEPGFILDGGVGIENFYHYELSDLLDQEKAVNTVWVGFETHVWWYNFALRLDERNFLAWFHLGFIHYKKEEWEKAEDCFRQCIRHNPPFLPAYEKIARVLSQRGFFKTALGFIDSGLENSPKEEGHDRLHVERGVILMRLGKYEDAVSEFDIAIDQIPDDSMGVFRYDSLLKVRALIELGKIPEIILVFKNLVQKYPSDLRSLNNLGYWYERNGQHDEAADCWKRCLSVDPELWSPNASLGMKAKNDNDTAVATKFFKTALKTCPDEARPIILEENMEMLQEYFDKEQLKTFGDKVADLSGFSLTGKSDVDEKNFVNHLRICDGFVFWIDPYFSKGGLEWLEEACMPPTLIKEIRLLTVWKPKGRDEIFGRKFPRSFKPTAEKIRAAGISFSFRVCVEIEYLTQIHQSFLMSKNGTWAVPRVMNIKVGSKDGVDPSTRKPSDFEEIWNNSLDYEKDYGELESKYNAWKAEQEE